MKLTEAERAKLAAAIKHFECLQKRYTKQHNGTACEHVKMALIGLDRLSKEPVVRCRECRYMVGAFTNNKIECAKGYKHMGLDSFCSCGARMDAPERAGKDGRDG